MKKFLLITYYWPPCGGVSVQRWLKLTKYFMNFNWLPTVLTTKNGDYPFIDKSLQKEVSPEIKVVKTKTLSYNKLLKMLLGEKESLPYGSLQTSRNDSILKKIIYFIRVQFVSPDARIVWNNTAIKAAEKLLKSGMYQAVVTTGPPHSTHMIGLKLKSKYGIKWIADFRDPWLKIHYHENENRNGLIKYIDKLMEKKVLKMADAIVTVSEKVSKTLYTEKNVIIPNAFDPFDYLSKVYTRNNRFRIKFVGALFDDRKKVVIQTIDWIEEYAKNKNIFDIEYTLIGAYEKIPEFIQQRLQYLKFKNMPFLNHDKVIDECVNSEILILVIVQSRHNEGILTYKLFEYLGSRTFILGVGPDASDAKDILQKAGAGVLYGYAEKGNFTNKIDELYQKWQAKEDFKNSNDLDEFSISATCAKYSELLNNITFKG